LFLGFFIFAAAGLLPLQHIAWGDRIFVCKLAVGPPPLCKLR
jgi:hypothetical protein